MRVLVAGAGPAGLYFSYLAEEQSTRTGRSASSSRTAPTRPSASAWCSPTARSSSCAATTPRPTTLITPQMEAWSDITVVHRGTPVVIDGIGFAAIGRLKLPAASAGAGWRAWASPRSIEKSVSAGRLKGYDLVVAADGVNSTVRGWHDFGTTISRLENKFAWYGTTKVFDTLTQTFVENEHGTFNAHHYRHSAEMSTFVVECDAANLGARRLCFHGRRAKHWPTAKGLRRHPGRAPSGVESSRYGGTSPTCATNAGRVGNMVLIGDALRTAHFSIGSGTRLAMEDAIALNKALAEESSIEKALAAFEAARRPIVDKLRRRGRRERRLVRALPRAHETRPARLRVELYSAQRPHRSGAAEENFPQIRRWKLTQCFSLRPWSAAIRSPSG